MLFLNDNLVWIVMGIVFESIINIMCKVDIYVVVKKFRFMEVLFLRIVLNYIMIVCYVLIKNMKKFCIENVDVERVVIIVMI